MKIIKLLGSLGFALSLIAGLAVILSISTVLESLHGTPFVQENFYQAHWFDLFLSLVWINIFCATLTRWPFKKKHVGFVITHIGILTLLLGALVTRLAGHEGQMTLFEEEAKDRLLESGFTLRVSLPSGGEEKFDLKAAPLKKPVKLPLENVPFSLELTGVIPHAEESRSLREDPSGGSPNRAVQAVLSSEMLGLKESFVLIEQDPADPLSDSRTIGPATFVLDTSKPDEADKPILRLSQKSAGKTFKLPITGGAERAEWKDAGLLLSGIRYYPKARIEKGRLVNLDGAPHPNPAVEFEITDETGRSEHHTRFSYFQEFDSLRGGPSNDLFGLRVELNLPGEAQTGPSFRFHVSDKNEWSYQIHSAKSGLSESKPLPLSGPIRTGWMDMTLEVKRTFDRAKIDTAIRPDPLGKSGIPAVELRILPDGQPEKTQQLLLGRSLLIGDEESGVRIRTTARSSALPFSLGLKDFRKIDYPGTSNPASFESDVVLRDTSSGQAFERTIRMNKPLDHLGWRVFQSSYIQDERLGEASVFTIAKNPGVPAIYGGAAFIFIGVILLFYFHPFFTGKKFAFAVLTLGALLGSPAFADNSSWQDMRSVGVQHNGRVKPFDAFARQTLRLITGGENWQKKDPAEFFADILSRPSSIADLKWIRAEYHELKNTLALDRKEHFFSLNELFPSLPVLEKFVRSAKDKRDADLRPSKLEQKSEELYTRIRTVQALIAGENFRKLPPASLSKTRLDLEVLYYRIKPFERAALLYFLASLVFAFLKRSSAQSRTGLWLALAAFIFHSMGLAARVYILERPPVSNMYESMIFMNWALMLFALLFRAAGRSDTVLSAGAAMSGFVMLYANLLPIDSSLDVVVAVLRSNYWLTVHVLTVVSSYGAFGLALGLGHRQLFLQNTGKLSKKAEHDSAALIFRIIQLGTLLIGTGTFLGGVWANESWGRFWGWDPKETWALITFLGYLLVVHLRYAKKISDFYLALSSIVGFLLVLMTWYGVNFVLGRGLHSYGAGSGGMAWIIYYLVFEAIFLGWALIKKAK